MGKIVDSKAMWMFRLYRDGLRQMTWGRTLWVLVAVKLVIIFAVLRMLFFRPYYSGLTPQEKQNAVAAELARRTAPPAHR